MEKVVVPQFVADWFEANECNKRSLYNVLKWIRFVQRLDNPEVYDWYHKDITSFKEQEIIAKMYIYGYRVEEKKYYWRKKKEYTFDFEDDDYIYLNIEKDTGEIYFSSKKNFDNFQTVLTEKEAKQAVGEKDFNKLERVEIDDVQ